MGYETKLIIGREGFESKEVAKGEPVFEEGEVYKPLLKDESGEYVYTGRTEVYFSVYATINLCKCGMDSNISKIAWKNLDKNKFWYWYNGNEQTETDGYGDSSIAIPIATVIEALEKDFADSEYRRFKWTLALLKSMQDDKENISVLFYGY